MKDYDHASMQLAPKAWLSCRVLNSFFTSSDNLE